MDIKKIYEYALQREFEGKRFFEDNAGRLSHAAAVEAFQQLALEEAKHIEFIQAQIDAVVAANPTLDEVLAELKRAQIEAVTFIEALPEEFAHRKATYVRMGQNIIFSIIHPQSHYEQIRAAIESARQ